MQRIREELLALKEHGNLRNIPTIQTKFDGRVIIDGKEFINFAVLETLKFLLVVQI